MDMMRITVVLCDWIKKEGLLKVDGSWSLYFAKGREEEKTKGCKFLMTSVLVPSSHSIPSSSLM